jgi:hypothetical protein
VVEAGLLVGLVEELEVLEVVLEVKVEVEVVVVVEVEVL